MKRTVSTIGRFLLGLSCLSALAVTTLTGCTPEGTHEPSAPVDLGRQLDPIVGGVAEAGYPGVGALAIDDPQYARAIFCTATLIAPQWVITAAHCLNVSDTGIDASMTSFFVGVNIGSGGTMHPADNFYMHPQYDPDQHTNDIGLVHLAQPVNGVASYPYNTTSMDNSWLGRDLFYVGYGMNDGVNDTGDGIKRSGHVYLGDLYMTTYAYYTSDSGGVMPCRGDSGGPGFATVGGQQKIVGIVSVGDQYCQQSGQDTRVDAFSGWITDTLNGGGSPENCEITGGDCAGQTCFPTETGFGCYPTGGLRPGQACDGNIDNWTDSLPCNDGAICLSVNENDPSDGQCFAYCRDDGGCNVGEYCMIPIFNDLEGIGVCVERPATCEITGGSCDAGQACYPAASGDNACFDSDGLQLDATCNPVIDDALPCGDGLVCLQVSDTETDGRCFDFCTADASCGALNYCFKEVFRDIDTIGVCLCQDLDDDSFCAVDDCNDNNAEVNPEHAEACDDRLDNDCDGQTDEGCGTEGEGEGGTEGEGEGGTEGEGEGGTEGEGEGGEACQDGLFRNCSCDDGTRAMQECLNGTWLACPCDGGEGEGEGEGEGGTEGEGEDEGSGGGGGGGGGGRRSGGCAVLPGDAPAGPGQLAVTLLLAGLGLVVLQRRRNAR